MALSVITSGLMTVVVAAKKTDDELDAKEEARLDALEVELKRQQADLAPTKPVVPPAADPLIPVLEDAHSWGVKTLCEPAIALSTRNRAGHYGSVYPIRVRVVVFFNMYYSMHHPSTRTY